jgi:hypothetical protein
MATTAETTFSIGGLLPATPDPKDSTLSWKLKASTTFPQGCVLAEATANPGIAVPWVTGASDGTQIPVGLLKYGCTTDANGGFPLTAYGGIRYDAPVYVKGTFRTDDLPQSGTGAIGSSITTKQPAWHIVSGSVTKGLIQIG